MYTLRLQIESIFIADKKIKWYQTLDMFNPSVCNNM